MQVAKVPGTDRGINSIFSRVTATMGKVVSPNQVNPGVDGRPILRHPNRFTNTAVPRFDGTVY